LDLIDYKYILDNQLAITTDGRNKSQGRATTRNKGYIFSCRCSSGLSLIELSDVNAPTLSDGMVLVYNGATSKWDATLTLTPGATQNLDINGGNF
jgi:hypothetical protein